MEVENIHPDPTLGIHFDPAAVLAHSANAVATWHTHPLTTPNLSQDDWDGFLAWPLLQHHIIGRGETGVEIKTYFVEDDLVLQL